MEEIMAAFFVYVAVGLVFIAFGVHSFLEKKTPTGFWANAKMFAVNDVKAYNRAMGKLWCIFGTVLIILGCPMFIGDGFILLSVIGVMFEVITTMVVYVTVIEPKYRKKE